MSHVLRFLAVTIAIPSLFVLGVMFTDYLERTIGRHWWDPWLGVACLLGWLAAGLYYLWKATA